MNDLAHCQRFECLGGAAQARRSYLYSIDVASGPFIKIFKKNYKIQPELNPPENETGDRMEINMLWSNKFEISAGNMYLPRDTGQ